LLERLSGRLQPYLAVDATALHGRFKGQLVAATTVDGHNWMFPVAYGVLEVESEESWTWFLQNLRDLIGHPHRRLQRFGECSRSSIPWSGA
jgi:hypothetical protein